MHVGLPIGEDSILMASDALESLGHTIVPGNNVYISVHPDSKEEADRIFNALSEGGEIEMVMADQAWGDYFGSLQDKVRNPVDGQLRATAGRGGQAECAWTTSTDRRLRPRIVPDAFLTAIYGRMGND